MNERLCEVEGCSNIGTLNGRGGRSGLCSTHRRKRWPAVAERERARDRARHADGRKAASTAAQLLRGEQVRNFRNHHRAVRHLLGGTPNDGLTVSRTCPDNCPDSWLGWHSSQKVEYRLCIPAHYVLESQAANAARKASA